MKVTLTLRTQFDGPSRVNALLLAPQIGGPYNSVRCRFSHSQQPYQLTIQGVTMSKKPQAPAKEVESSKSKKAGTQQPPKSNQSDLSDEQLKTLSGGVKAPIPWKTTL